MRIMLDSNVHDLIANDQSVLSAIQQRIADGRLTLVSTHVQRDELSRALEPKRAALLEIYGLAESVSTTGAVWDVSSWDECSWGTDEANASIVELMSANPNHAEDALIAATAAGEADALVTNETRLASKIRRAGFSVKVWSWSEFVAWLGYP
jgi:predicted nucleic acid-binding protein